MAKKYLLALDQATQTTGWALFQDGKLADQGIFSPPGSLEERLTKIRKWLLEFLDKYPNEIEVAIEEIQLQNIPGQPRDMGVTTYKKLAYVQGILIELLTSKNIPYTIVSSSSWKSTCAVKGKNSKEQKANAAAYVLQEFNISPIQDACDAICIGQHILKTKYAPAGFDWGM